MTLNNYKDTQYSTILDQILEKATNIEKESNTNKIVRILNQAIWLNGRHERDSRKSTLAIKYDEKDLTIEAIDAFFDEWIETNERMVYCLSQDKENVNVHFALEVDKTDFLNTAGCQQQGSLTLKLIQANIQPPNIYGEHFTRKRVRIEIANIKQFVDTSEVKKALEKMLGTTDHPAEFKESKASKEQRFKAVYFRLTQEGFNILFKNHGGKITYKKAEGSKRTRINLHAKINAKPFQCRDCFSFGQHKCNGKVCINCAKPGHLTKDCPSKVSYCDNCSMKGHKAKDTHCPAYLDAVACELRRMDIPLRYLEQEEDRLALIKHLRLK